MNKRRAGLCHDKEMQGEGQEVGPSVGRQRATVHIANCGWGTTTPHHTTPPHAWAGIRADCTYP